MKKISVIIPAYNAEDTISQCLDSVVSQNVDFEVMVFDDCSRDRTVEIVKDYQDKDERIQITSLEKNIGQGEIRNLGIKEAQGEYILCLDADDWLADDALPRMINRLEIDNTDVALFDYTSYWQATGKLKRNARRDLFDVEDDKVIAGDERCAYVFNMLAPWNKICRREFLLENAIRFKAGRVFEDLGWSLQVIFFAKKISIINDSLLFYRKASGSSMRSMSDEHLSLFDMYESLLDTLTTANADQSYLDAVKARMLQQYMKYLPGYHRKMSSQQFSMYKDKLLGAINRHQARGTDQATIKYMPPGRGEEVVRQLTIFKYGSMKGISLYEITRAKIQGGRKLLKKISKRIGPLKTRILKLLLLFISLLNLKVRRFKSGYILTEDTVTDSKVRGHLYDCLYVDFIKAAINNKKINIVIDVGANKGQFARLIRNRVGFKGQIYSFEPIPELYEKLEKMAKKDPNWKVYNMALGELAETKTFYQSKLAVFSSFLKPNDYSLERYGSMSSVENTFEVDVKRMEDVLSPLDIPVDSRCFFKLDTQGFDISAYKGLGSFEAQVKMLQTEVSMEPIYQDMHSWSESIDFFTGRGFDIGNLFPVTIDDKINKAIEYDCVMFSSNQ